MLYGKSLFESVLTRIEEEAPVPPIEEDAGHRIRGLSTGFVTEAMEGISVSLHRIDAAYLDFEAETTAEKAPDSAAEPIQTEAAASSNTPPPLPPHLQRVKPAEIAEDLGIAATDTLGLLQDRRRLFAKDNHPDVVHPLHRHAATQRMMLANLMIDQAIRRVEARDRLRVRQRR